MWVKSFIKATRVDDLEYDLAYVIAVGLSSVFTEGQQLHVMDILTPSVLTLVVH